MLGLGFVVLCGGCLCVAFLPVEPAMRAVLMVATLGVAVTIWGLGLGQGLFVLLGSALCILALIGIWMIRRKNLRC